MSDPQLSRRTLVRLPEELRGRRRSAPKIERSSDVTRTRGWLLGSVLGGLGLAAALGLALAQGRSVGPSRSFGRPHALAGLDCRSCHDEGRPGPATVQHDPADSCVGCHEDQRSTRAPHAALLARKAMRCTTCHPIHTAMGGLSLAPGQAALRWRGEDASTLELEPLGAAGWTGREGVEVALVELAACAGCHTPTRADDPMAHCALGDRRGPADIAVCFDEHTPLLVAAGSERAAVWELAREAAALPAPALSAADTERERRGAWTGPLSWLGLSLGLAGFGWFGGRTLARRRDRVALARASSGPGSADASAPLRPAERRRLPTIDTHTCIGCSACVDACPYDVLELRAYVAVVAKPDDCCGLSLCEQRCPNGSLVISEGERIADLPGLDDALASTSAPGVYLAGDVTGLPLIRNAINQGAHATAAIAASLRATPAPAGCDYELIIVGAGPAGISAALEAEQQGLRYLVLEQASAAESIRSFPRGKLVFDQPLGMPMVGELWLRESSKEELLGKWLRIIRSHALNIREQTRVVACTRGAEGVLELRAGQDADKHANKREGEGEGERFTCARVLLACGRRGTPRKLDAPVAEAMLDHVHYTLADARSFAGRRVCVVGLGDVAMEAALGLANQPGTQVTLSYRGTAFKRGKRRNIEAVQRLVAAGRIELCWGTEVDAVEPGRVRLRPCADVETRAPRTLEIDAVFVMIGNVAPRRLLQAFGVD